MKKSKVSGVAGSVRVQPLSLAELAKQELHGKRQDTTSKARQINNVPPITTTGLDLRSLYDAHVEGAFVPKANTRAIQVLIQFPTELVDLDDPEALLWHGRAIGKRIWGEDAIFADRYDRDEKSRGVVDLFLAPKYIKTTKRDPEGRLAVSMTKHNKLLAQKHRRKPTQVWEVGRALQDEVHEYFRDVMGLKGVKRGSPKIFAGSDWKSAEQLREEELETMKAELEAKGAAAEAEKERLIAEGKDQVNSMILKATDAIPTWKESAEAAGREAGYEAGLKEGRAKVAEEEAEARRAREAATQKEQDAQRARDAADDARRLDSTSTKLNRRDSAGADFLIQDAGWGGGRHGWANLIRMIFGRLW